MIEVAGSEIDGETTIEFSRALVTGEPTDVPFMDMGPMTMISFHATADDFVSYHSKPCDVVTLNYLTHGRSHGGDGDEPYGKR